MRFRIFLLAIITVAAGVHAAGVAGTGNETSPVSSVEDLRGLLRASQKQFYVPSIPSTSQILWDVRGDNVDIFVDWNGFKPSEKKNAIAILDKNMIPRYEIHLWEDPDPETGTIIIANAYGETMAELRPERDFLSLGWAYDYFGTTDLSPFQQAIHASWHTALFLKLTPVSFAGVCAEIREEEALLAAQESLPMMMSMGSGGEIPLPVDVVPQTNGTVELWIDTSGTSIRHLEIFSRRDLVYPPGWSLVLNNLNADSVPVSWSDATTNQMFYYVNDSDNDGDGDGYSCLRERLITLTPTNTFNYIDSDGDGLQDWFEIRFWGSTALYDATDDPDGDGLPSGDEMVYAITPGMTNVVFYSDPSLFDSDFEGLNDYDERRVWGTSAMDPDSDSDGRTDAAEALGSPATDPNNDDIISPLVAFLGN